ncbi:MAG: dienelactone hydrolase family protein [Thermohalobaculum sp.]|nr:dienelactone hydrolase family protein [Thermohalobaculum sp.]
MILRRLGLRPGNGRRGIAWRSAAALGLSASLMHASGAPAQSRGDLVRIAASGSAVSLNAELVRPAGPGRFPAVILMHGCGGWQPAVLHALRQLARELRDQGHVVLNLDSFGPRGLDGGVVCESFERLREAREFRTQDAFDALAHLQGLDFVDPARVFLIGQSNGGSVALKAAEAGASRRYGRGGPGFRGVVAYYPWCDALGTSRPALEAPLVIFGGARDDWVPPDGCRRFRASGAALEVRIYPRAAHSFDLLAPEHRYLGKLVGYDREATEDSRRRILDFFRTAIREG